MASVASNPKEALVNEVRGEYDRIQLRMNELQTLIDQSQAEVKRLQQKSVDMTTQLNRLETNFETVPRNDIKLTYTNVIDTRTRLLTMQSQVEKVQQDRTQLENFSKTLARLLEMVEGVPTSSVIGITDTSGVAPVTGGLFGNLKTAASTTFQKVRDFIFDLRPMMLDDLGLAPTVRRYVDAFAEKSSVETQLNILGEERRRMESHTEVTMFRAIQEILGYTRDVANATKATVVLDVLANPVKATVSFNGNDVNETEVVVEQNNDKIFGLAPLRERVELVGGAMQVFGGVDGNRVEVSLPSEQNT